MNKHMKIPKGFTLIELLVVIAIIGILISAAIASYNTARAQARDARRVEDMHNIQIALEQYKTDTGAYPASYGSAFVTGTAPTDPLNSSPYTYNWTYYSPPNYCVCGQLETKTGNANTPTNTSCTWNSSGTYYCIKNQQ